MIPILHPADSTSWLTFGLGALSDAISCEVLEERNGQYELEMTYPVSGQHYLELALRKIILAKPNFSDNPQPFRIYNISRPLNGIVTVSAQHICYDLSGYVVSPFSAVGVQSALVALTANATPSPCPFTFESDMSGGGTMEVTKPMSIRALMGGTEGSILDHWTGEWSYNGRTCRFDANRGMDRGVTIRYGKNLTSIEQEENNASVYTGIYPFWYNTETKALVTLTEKTINVPGSFGYTKICPVDLSDRFESEPTEAQLRAAAQTYISSNGIGVPAVNLRLGFVQLEEIKERVDLCDTVHVYFDALGVSASAKCVRTRWNVLKEQYNEIELGSIRTSIAKTIAGIRETAEQAHTATSTLADTARTVSQKITGQLGGYVVMNDTDSDGQPDEILIMDSPDKETAVNVIRMNNGGIAFSQDGYNGTYGTAWSIDGQFVADYITSGTLQANLIQILGTTNFYWDAGNIYIINPNDNGQQIRIGQYDGTRYGIGFTRDGGLTWQTAMDFQGLNVSATGFSKTYVSLTPPDPADYGLETFNVGDVWVESDRRYTWNEVGENTWSWAAQRTWQELGGATEPNMYTWNGGSWQKIYDGESFTSFETRLTVAEQSIAAAVVSVASKGVTYIQLTDPRNDSDVTVNLGDHWVKADPGHDIVTWNHASTMTWDTLASNLTWNNLEGVIEYAWDGYEWIPVSDHGAEVRHETAIVETDKQITLMAQSQTLMNDQLVENTAQLTIQANRIASEVTQRKAGEATMTSRINQNASSITSEVSRAKSSEGSLSSRITQTEGSITSEVNRAKSSESSLSSRISQNAGSITSEVSRAKSSESSLSSRITQTEGSITSEVSRSKSAESSLSSRISQNAGSITSEVNRAKSSEGSLSSRITQTEGSITSEVNRAKSSESSLSSRITQTEGSITSEVNRAKSSESSLSSRITQTEGSITSEVSRAKSAESSIRSSYVAKSIVEISDNKIELSCLKFDSLGSQSSGIYISPTAIKISSGGTFELTSSYFNVDKTGKITATSGTIGGWQITPTELRRLSSVTDGVASTQYGAFLFSPSAISSTSRAIAIGSRAWNGSSYGGWSYPFYVDYSGKLTATAATIQGNITVDSISFSNGVTMNAENLTDGSIGTSKIGDGSVTYSKGSSGVKTSLDNGDAAKATIDSLIAGSITATELSATKVTASTVSLNYLKISGGSSRNVSWFNANNLGGKFVLGYAP